MKCPDSHCSGYSEFVRQSPSGADIHLCGECGREWGVPAWLHDEPITCGASMSKTKIMEGVSAGKTLPEDLEINRILLGGGHGDSGIDFLGLTRMQVGVNELQPDPARVTYPMPGQVTRFTTMDIEITRESQERIDALRDMIDEHIYWRG